MRVFADTDLLVFLYTLGRILLFSPLRLAQNRSGRYVPGSLEFEELSPGSLSEAQAKYLETYDRKLADLNYQPTATYRTTNINFGKNLIRSYVNPLEPIRAVVMIVEVTVNVNGILSSAHSCTTEFITRFTDETALITRNMQRKTLFDNPPFRITQECPRVSEPAELRRRHLSKLEQMDRVPNSARSDFTSIVEEVQEGHRRFLSYQLERGAYRLNPRTGGYETTAKVHWRGIRNHLNPFLHLQRAPQWRFPAAAALGIGTPVLASLFIAPTAARHAVELSLPASLASGLTMLSAYALAGTAIGFLVQRSNFLWTFLITYLAVGAILGFHIHAMPYSTLAGIIAHVVAQSAKRRRLILQPTVPAVSVETRTQLVPLK